MSQDARVRLTSKAFILILSMINVRYGVSIVLYAKECPSYDEWQFRAKQLECNDQKGETYHCILDVGGQLLETCLRKKTFHSNGGQCPWVFISGDGEILFGEPLSKCNVPGCPSSEMAKYFDSDELYKFPECFVPTSDRLKQSSPGHVPTSTSFKTSSLSIDTSTPSLPSYTVVNLEESSQSALIVVLIALLVLSMLAHIWNCCKRRETLCRGNNGLKGKNIISSSWDSSDSEEGFKPYIPDNYSETKLTE